MRAPEMNYECQGSGADCDCVMAGGRREYRQLYMLTEMDANSNDQTVG